MTDVLEIIKKKIPAETRFTRIVLPSHPGDPYYVFLLLPEPKWSTYEQYRVVRRNLLEACCRVLKLKYPDAQDIMGIATEPGMTEQRSEDAIYFDARHWTEADQADALELQKTFGLLQDLTGFARPVEEYPELPDRLVGDRIQPVKRQMKGRDRNLSCPCGSGKKYKKCCGK